MAAVASPCAGSFTKPSPCPPSHPPLSPSPRQVWGPSGKRRPPAGRWVSTGKEALKSGLNIPGKRLLLRRAALRCAVLCCAAPAATGRPGAMLCFTGPLAAALLPSSPGLPCPCQPSPCLHPLVPPTAHPAPWLPNHTHKRMQAWRSLMTRAATCRRRAGPRGWHPARRCRRDPALLDCHRHSLSGPCYLSDSLVLLLIPAAATVNHNLPSRLCLGHWLRRASGIGCAAPLRRRWAAQHS